MVGPANIDFQSFNLDVTFDRYVRTGEDEAELVVSSEGRAWGQFDFKGNVRGDMHTGTPAFGRDVDIGFTALDDCDLGDGSFVGVQLEPLGIMKIVETKMTYLGASKLRPSAIRLMAQRPRIQNAVPVQDVS